MNETWEELYHNMEVHYDELQEKVNAAIQEAREREREACAVLVDNTDDCGDELVSEILHSIALAIRARSERKEEP